MKSDKLIDAIGLIDEKLIERSQKSSQKSQKRERIKRFIKWTVPVAAVLALTIGVGSLFGNTPIELNAYAIAEAKYPETVKYPADDTTESGFAEFQKWNKEFNERIETYFNSDEKIEGFLERTIQEFLSAEDNTVYSPINVYLALSMLAETADGNTREQILTLLEAEDIKALRKQANTIWNASYRDDGLQKSILGSSLWLNEDITFKKSTLDILANNYYASSFKGEMGSSNYNKALKEWINEQTGGLLKESVENVEMPAETLMAIVTTIYFNASWKNEFKATNNDTKVFKGVSGHILTEFMNKEGFIDNYYWGEAFSATHQDLEQGGRMWFILPDENVSIENLLNNNEALEFIADPNDWKNKKTMKVNLSVPKFDVSSNISLIDGLKALGITDCFDSSLADFSNLSDNDSYISAIEHAARVKIDEEGVEAAAYTVILDAGSAMPSGDEIDFILDRPFIFVITSDTGLPLFVGNVNNL